jgi:aminoacylase
MTFVTRNSDNDTIAVQNFQEYLRIKTVYPNPDYESCNAFLERLAKDVGLDFQSIECVKGKPIAIMTMPGRRPDLSSLMLNSHTDVVQVFEDKWTQDPFGGARVKQENGDYKIYGRGSQDMKIVGITYVEAIRRLKQLGWQPLRTIHITFVPDEEIGGDDGMQALLLTDTFKKMNVGLCLDEGMANPENAYKLYYGERIGWWCRITAHGNTGHGSQFIKNVAINKLVSYRRLSIILAYIVFYRCQ